MKIYLVGGAVRDRLLKRAVKEKDWVVVGATVSEMLKLGYRQVGKDFPVFLHPNTNEEYALARTERKVGRGYTGFTFDVSPEVTLTEDLMRRDLTINAMAETPEGHIEDPFHGQADLEQKLLRHVSDAFVEDPVRILRVARFKARFAELGFNVAPETIKLMRQMVQSGEVDALVSERVWKELERALAEKHPEQFFQVLQDAEALPVLFPTISMKSRGMAALIKATGETSDVQIRFAALLHDQTVDEVRALIERYRVPNDYRDLALLVARYGKNYEKTQTRTASELVDFLQQLDAYRRTERFKKFLQTCQIIFNDNKPSDFLMQCLSLTQSIDVAAFASGLKGSAIADKLREERIKKIETLK